jgi:hypothetical protein
MNTKHARILVTAAALLAAVGCQNTASQKANGEMNASADSSETQGAMNSAKAGKVLETMSTAGYTYVQVDTGRETFWAAAPEFDVEVGDKVSVPSGMPMENYHSQTLNRDFNVVYFVPGITVAGKEGAAQALPEGHPSMGADAQPANLDLSGIEQAKGGDTVAGWFGKKAGLAGKEVRVHGKVVKVNNGIMGRNWIHVQDGTGEAGSNDLTVTTDAVVKVGDLVLVKGTAAIDKDFGAGYKYDLIVENAEVTVQ